MLLSVFSFLGLWLMQGPIDLFQQAPPEVDNALRARVSKFYQAHVDGKFRLADQCVAEDSKDYFFEAKKPRWKDFELSRMLYSDNFTRATVTVFCGTEMVMTGAGGVSIPQKIPLTTTWKLVNGEWFWYYAPPKQVATPWGNSKITQTPEIKDGTTEKLHSLPPIPQDGQPPTMASMIKVDKSQVELPADAAGSAEVSIRHALAGSVTLALRNPHVPGLHAKLDRGTIKAGETAHLTIHYVPPSKGPKPSAAIQVHFMPLDEIVPIEVRFTTPAQK